MGGVYGGQNMAHIFRARKGASAIEFFAADGTTAATGAANKSLAFNLTVSTDVQFQEDGSTKIVFDQDLDNDALYDLLKAVAHKKTASSATKSERKYENGTSNIAADASGELVLINVYGGETEDGKIKVTSLIGKVAPTSGSFKQASGESSKPTFEVTGILMSADTNIKAFLDAGIVTAPSTYVIAKDYSYALEYMAAV
jgi:hypothetical protein